MPDRMRWRKVVEANPIAEVVGEYLPMRPDEDGFRGLCPFHGEHDQSFRIEPAGACFHCSACRVSGDVVDFVRMYEAIDTSEALDMLEARRGS